MNFKTLKKHCLSFPFVTEEVRWRQDHCFLVLKKPFCLTDSDTYAYTSFKVLESEFDEMINREGIIPAPYMDREHWVLVLDFAWLSDAEWEHFIQQSYELVKSTEPENIP